MSADRYSECPRCKRKREAAAQQAHHDADAAYGKVSIDEFDALRAKAEGLTKDIDQAEDEYTFREDYGFARPDEDGVSVSYRGGCSIESCGLAVTFQHDIPVPD